MSDIRTGRVCVKKTDELDVKVLESLRAVLEILEGFYGSEE